MNPLLVLLLSVMSAAATPGDAVSLDGLQSLGDTRHHVFTSELLGKDYHVFVGLPRDYDQDRDTSYPTIYVLDGGVLYPLFRSYSRLWQLSGEAPEFVLVGISYGTDDWQEGNARSHDFTAPADEHEFWGGAANFQGFLENELVPFIERTYRSRPDRRVIFGRSLGGQFVLFTAQTKPDLFWGHIASNPALHRNLGLFLSTHPDAPETESHLFVSSASNDDPTFREPALKWIDYWSRQKTLPWRLHVETLEGHNHFSTPAEAFRGGVVWLFPD